jgi:hypothetical protein
MTDVIEPRNNSDIEKSGLDINTVPFVEVDQPGPASLGKQAKGSGSPSQLCLRRIRLFSIQM